MRADLKLLAEGLIESVKSYVRNMHETLAARVTAVERRLTELPAPKEGPAGKDAPPVDEAALCQRILAALPAPAVGKDGRDGADGRSVTLEEVRPLVTTEVARAVGALPPAQPGRDGRDGLNGQQGEKGVDGKDGRHGVDGKDALGFDDISVEHDGYRGFTLKFQQGERVKAFAFTLPIVLDRGVFKEGQHYARGDGTTWAGSFWIAQADTTAKPDAGDGAWRLAVKRGRDGRDGKDGAPGERGEQGERGIPGLDGRRAA